MALAIFSSAELSTAATISVDDPLPEATANGLCSLIEAIDNANGDAQIHGDCPAGSGADIIELAESALYVLTAVNNSTFDPTGLPVITSPIVIEGNGSTLQRSDAAPTPLFRLIVVGESGSLTINNLSLMNGRTGHPPEFSQFVVGSGLLNLGSLTLNDSLVSGNWGETHNGGGIGSIGVLTLNNTIVSFNSAGDDGGGIAARGIMSINGSQIVNNDATDELAGGIYWFGNEGEAVVRDSTVGMNTAALGGGIFSAGTMTVLNTTVMANVATVANQPHVGGGGIFNSGTITIVNSTLSGNSAAGGSGGGLLNMAQAHLTNSTIAENGALFGGNVMNSGGSDIELKNVLMAGALDGGDCLNEGSVSASIANLIEDGSCDTQFSGNPLLAPLADNGGPTLTHALLPTSPAIDRGSNEVCAASPVDHEDQRGEPRPVDGDGDGFAQCDIGAYEEQVTTPTCHGLLATIFVDASGIIRGGPKHGQIYKGVLVGTPGNDVILGTAGDDIIIGGRGDDVICGGAHGNNKLQGGQGDDILIGGAGEDLLQGGSGNDILIGGPGADFFQGGGGVDTAVDFNSGEGDKAVGVEDL